MEEEELSSRRVESCSKAMGGCTLHDATHCSGSSTPIGLEFRGGQHDRLELCCRQPPQSAQLVSRFRVVEISGRSGTVVVCCASSDYLPSQPGASCPEDVYPMTPSARTHYHLDSCLTEEHREALMRSIFDYAVTSCPVELHLLGEQGGASGAGLVMQKSGSKSQQKSKSIVAAGAAESRGRNGSIRSTGGTRSTMN